ncbi:hypothetical protein B0H19DRAFT_1262605 [Mycena capillaripes]|nr:hypothetical protein B0H19DRAFT_1262605 [Mycena capillaripes]
MQSISLTRNGNDPSFDSSSFATNSSRRAARPLVAVSVSRPLCTTRDPHRHGTASPAPVHSPPAARPRPAPLRSPSAHLPSPACVYSPSLPDHPVRQPSSTQKKRKRHTARDA